MPGPNINLADLFKSDPMAANIGMQFLGQDAARNDADLASVTSSTNRQNALLPGELEHQGLQNKTATARLPGVVAESSMSTDKASLSRNTMEQQLDDLIKGHDSKDSARHLKELQDATTAYGQVAPILAQVPGPARAAMAKQLLGSMYRPEFDQMNPDQLVNGLKTMSEQAGMAANKYQIAIAAAQAKGNTQLEVQRLRNEGMMGVQRLKNELRQMAEKVKASGDPKNYQHAATQLLTAAQQEDDPDRKMILLQQAQEFVNLTDSYAKARAAAGQAGKIDAGAASGLPTNPMPPAPTVTGGGKPKEGTAENPIVLK